MYRSVPKSMATGLPKYSSSSVLDSHWFHAHSRARSSCLGCSAVKNFFSTSQFWDKLHCVFQTIQMTPCEQNTDFVCLGLLRYIANAGLVLAGIMKITVACINRGVASKWIEFEYMGRTIPLNMQACDRWLSLAGLSWGQPPRQCCSFTFTFPWLVPPYIPSFRLTLPHFLLPLSITPEQMFTRCAHTHYAHAPLQPSK